MLITAGVDLHHALKQILNLQTDDITYAP